MKWYTRAVYVFGAAFVAIGVALLGVTAANGGGVLGYVMGALFIGLGVGRITVERNRPGRSG